jgi:hypothetical protein
MSRREERLREAQLAAAKERKRLVLFGAGLLTCIAIIVALNWGAGEDEDAAPPVADVQGVLALPPIEDVPLDLVRDATDSQRVILEAEPFAGLLAVSRGLFGGHLKRLGEPVFPFANAAERADELRGGIYRMRGSIVEADIIERTAGEPEFWCLVETPGGERFFYATSKVPKTLFGSLNYVLADGIFFKYYTRTLGDTRATAPLLVGRELVASYPEVAPVPEPNTLLLAEVVDPDIGSDEPLDERGLWHLLNVARTVMAEDGGTERAFADAQTLDDPLLEDLAQAPEIYRGQPFLLGGMVRGRPSPVNLGENPLRMPQMETAWLRNNSSGVDTLLHLLAPQGFDFNEPEGAVLFHGWFLQLYAYEDRDGNLRRAPVFIVTDIEGVAGKPPPWASDVLWGFIGLSVLLAGAMVVLIRRDKKRAAEFDAMRRARRRGLDAG